MAAVIPHWVYFLEGCSGDMLRQEMISAEFQHIPREPMAKTQGCATGLSSWLEETADSLQFVPGTISCLLLNPEG